MAKLPASVKVRHGEVKKEPDAEEAKGANCRDTSLPIVRRCKSVVSDWWLGELAAAGVSLICLVGIFAVLATFDNHQIPDFYYGLTVSIPETTQGPSNAGEISSMLSFLSLQQLPRRL